MKAQISRDGFRADRRYSGVYQQQGRMIIDRDWNELVDILKTRIDDALVNVIGSGTPKGRAAALQLAGSALRIVPGTVYAGGVEARVAAKPGVTANPFNFADQADFPSAPPVPGAGTAYRVYADVWERTVVSLEDDNLRDPALHGADTCARTQTMAQIKWCPVAKDPENPAHNPGRGDAPLTVLYPAGGSQGGTDPCDPQTLEVDPVGGDFLFRVEVHDARWSAGAAPDNPDRVVIKWSRENGAEQYERKDAPDWFKSGPWLFEEYGDTAEKHLGFHLADGPWTPERGTLSAAFPTAGNLVRRWEGYAVAVRSGSAWSLSSVNGERLEDTAPGANGKVDGNRLTIRLTDLEFSVPLAGKVFLPGDFWTVPVRSATYEAGKTLLDAALPQGIVHRYVTLAEVQANGQLRQRTAAEERRLSFPRLSELDASDLGYTTSCASGLFGNTHDTVKKALDRLCEISAQHVAYAKPQGGDTSIFKGHNPSTVRQALDLLADVKADDIGYTPPQGFQSIVQVKSALDELFGRPVGTGNRVTVGSGGQYATIDAALNALSSKTKDIALALMPGEHQLPAGVKGGGSDVNLSIVGLGEATRIRATAGAVRFYALASLTLERLKFILGTGGSLWVDNCSNVSLIGNTVESTGLLKSDFGAVRITLSHPVLMRDNVLDVQYAETPPFLVQTLALESFDNMEEVYSLGITDFRARILALSDALLALPESQRKTLGEGISSRAAQNSALSSDERDAYKFVGDNLGRSLAPSSILPLFEHLRSVLYKLNPGTAIMLTNVFASGSVVLENNRMNGFLGLYGMPRRDAVLGDKAASLLPAANSGKLSANIVGDSRLHVRHSFMPAVRAGAQMVNGIATALGNNGTISVSGIFDGLILAGNSFDKEEAQFIAGQVHLNSNVFHADSNIAGWTLSFTGVYTGNAEEGVPKRLWSGVARGRAAHAANLLEVLTP